MHAGLRVRRQVRQDHQENNLINLLFQIQMLDWNGIRKTAAVDQIKNNMIQMKNVHSKNLLCLHLLHLRGLGRVLGCLCQPRAHKQIWMALKE